MRLVQFVEGDKPPRVGVELKNGGDIVDLCKGDPSIPSTTLELIAAGNAVLDKAQRVIQSGQYVVSRNQVQLTAPISRPDKVICIGMNYRDHCTEQNVPIPVKPVVFNKFPSTIVGPYDDVRYPGGEVSETDELDWEVELVIVIGKKGKHIKAAEASEYVFGYTVAHDVSARDWQMKKNGGQWLLGKTMDDFCPIGPVIVTSDELPDAFNLKLECRVNGVIKQSSNTDQIIHKADTLLSFISRFVTLLPGDIILTGTPPGVGCFRKPPEYLKRGDVVECEIEKIGTIRNKVI